MAQLNAPETSHSLKWDLEFEETKSSETLHRFLSPLQNNVLREAYFMT
jgi:hypothetical protein